MNDVLRTIEERYSCRAYDGRLPEKEKLDAIARAAVQAPSAMNLQPWQVVVVADKAMIDELDAEAMRILAAAPDKTMYQRMMDRGGKIYYNAPCLYLIWQKPGDASPLDVGIVSQNIALAATSLGLGNVICRLVKIPLEGPNGADYKAKLGCPEGYEYGMGILVGYAVGEGAPHQPDMGKIRYIPGE